MTDIFKENLKKLSLKELFSIYHLNVPTNKDLIIKEVESRILDAHTISTLTNFILETEK